VTLAEVEARLTRVWVEGPPGPAAHLRLAPSPRPGWQAGELSPTARTGAAIVLVFDGERGASVLLTVRTRGLPHHAGQVSLPGGGVDAGETIEQAALREAHEEVGIDPRRVRVLGALTPLYIPVSRFNLYPVVAAVDGRPAWRPSPHEVDSVLEVAIDELADPAALRWERLERPSGGFDVPVYRIHGERLWGATAMIVTEFLCAIGLDPDPGPIPRSGR